jgi:hypothetical protein
MKILHTNKVPYPKVDVWSKDYGAAKVESDPEEDASDESKALEHEPVAKPAVLPKNDQSPIIEANPINLQPHKKHESTGS